MKENEVESERLIQNEETSICRENPKSEQEDNHKARWRTIRVAYLLMCFSSIKFALVMSSLWPYLRKVDSSLSATFLGWTNAGFSLAQLVSLFGLGVWCDKRNAKEPLIFAVVCMIAGSLIYSCGESLPIDGVYLILAGRILHGISAGNVAVCRAIVSQSTTLMERTKAISNLASFQGVGYTLGPILQLAAVPIGDRGIQIASIPFTLDLYTAPGIIGVLLGGISLALILIFYKEVKIDIYEGQEDIEMQASQSLQIDLKAVTVTAVLFVAPVTAWAAYETLNAPLIMDEYALTYKDTILYSSIILTFTGSIGILFIQLARLLSSKFEERKLIAVGFMILLVAMFLYIPWGNTHPKLQTAEIINGTKRAQPTTGCYIKYTWCKTTPKLYLPQFVAATILYSPGFAILFGTVQVAYSKLLGPNKQGGYMAFLSSLATVAKMIGQVLMSFLYTYFGPRWAFLSVDAFIAATMILFFCFYHRIVPYHKYMLQKNATK